MKDVCEKILLVDDDKALTALLAEYLQNENFVVNCVDDGQAAIDEVQQSEQYGVIVLDIMMPGLDGLEVLQILRQRVTTPIIMLTGRGDDIDRIIGLEMGADDYLAKPCNPRELLARIRAILRRSRTTNSPLTSAAAQLQIHGLSLDCNKREVHALGNLLDLTGAEFNILLLLMQSAGQAIGKEVLTLQVLHREMTAYDRSIDVHVSRLRKKLEAATHSKTDFIKTIRGSGYQFVT